MKNIFSFIIIVLILPISSCKKFLDKKPDATLTTPSSLADLQGLLDNYNFLNAQYVGSTEILADNYYLTSANWAALNRDDQRNYYLWKPDDNNKLDWNQAYRNIYTCNLVLEELDKINAGPDEEILSLELKGAAFFFRGSYFYSIAQLFAEGYDSATSANGLGIPLRLTTNLQEKSTRPTLKATYERIIDDLKSSIMYLPRSTPIKSRPSITAAYGYLARVYLSMQDYINADKYADSCLTYFNNLIDYNDLNSNLAIPFSVFNSEVIFQATSYPVQPLSPSVSKVDSGLYNSYQENDIRKIIFFKSNGNGTYAFKGNYDGNRYNGQTFTGIATNEQYLIKAECGVRIGKVEDARSFINDLLEKRWKTNTYIPFNSTDTDSLLSFILNERRKELIFRSLRLTDLKRLNKDNRFAVTLHRRVDNVDYYLKPNDQRYVELLPKLVIEMTGMKQNP